MLLKTKWISTYLINFDELNFRFMKLLAALLLVFFGCKTMSFSQKNDSLIINQFFQTALSKGKAYDDLRYLCKTIGPRLSGSAQAEMAVKWGEALLKTYGFDHVNLQAIKVPHWERGTKEVAWMKNSSGALTPLEIVALGGSISTNGLLSAEVIEFETVNDLKKATEKAVKGKIVFLNQPMNPNEIVTFKAYGGCYSLRNEGAVEASKLGAVGVIIRSLALPNDHFPHTGSMHYDDNVAKIPAGALSTNAANLLSATLKKEKVTFLFEMNCRDFPDADSYNVMGELIGSEFPNQIITIGGHLDSWDTGEGAHDDGAGIVHCIEALRILKENNIQPKHTIRVVLFMNEENGNRGGLAYAAWSKSNNETQIAAVESDRGGFSPRGFECDGSPANLTLIQSFKSLLLPYGLYHFEKGYGGVDIGPLKSHFENIPLFGFVPDSQRYFDFHHAASDVFENVNKRELELGCASMAAFVYLLDKGLD
jgi:hypothetical protein